MKTALITGVTSGIGSAIATALSNQGWHVIGLYHKTKPDFELAKAYAVDLSDLAATKELGNRLVKELPRIDAFIHVAGMWHDEHEALANKQLADFTPEQITASMNVGVTSVMLLCSILLPHMPSGTVVGVSGTFAEGAAGWLPYYTSKRALEDFLVGLSQDYKDIKVFGISPADTATPAYQKFYPQYAAEAQSPEAVAEVIVKLIAGKSGFKSGDIIEVRGGVVREGCHI